MEPEEPFQDLNFLAVYSVHYQILLNKILLSSTFEYGFAGSCLYFATEKFSSLPGVLTTAFWTDVKPHG